MYGNGPYRVLSPDAELVSVAAETQQDNPVRVKMPAHLHGRIAASMSCNALGLYKHAERIIQCPLKCTWQTHLTNAETRRAVCQNKINCL